MRPSFLILAVALAAGASGCGRKPGAQHDARVDAPPARVHLAKVIAQDVPEFRAVPGTVRPFARASYAAKVSGTIASTNLAVGKTVSAGDLLVVIRADEYAARADQARAAERQADREYEREVTLEKAGASTSDAVRAADDRRQQAHALSQESAAMLTYTRVTAPFDGVITAELVKPGDLAMPGRALFELEGTTQLRAEVQVPESLATPAADTNLSVDLGDTIVPGRLVELSPSADPVSRTRMAKVALGEKAPARSGQFVRVLWPAGQSEQRLVPASAVSANGQFERVFVVQDGRARLRIVKTGARHDALIEIVSGLDVGEAVISDPPASLRDAQPVEIVP